MKNVLKFTGIIAIVAVMGLVLACKQEEKKGVSLLSAPKISEAPGWADVTGVQEATYAEAISIFSSANNSGLETVLADSTNQLFYDAFIAKYTSAMEWYTKNQGQSSYKVELSVNGNGPATKAGDSSDSNIVAVKGKASDESKLKGYTLGEFYTAYIAAMMGDTTAWLALQKDGTGSSGKSSTSLTFTFPLIKSGDYLIGGTLKIENKDSGSDTIKTNTPPVGEGKTNTETKYAFALTIVDKTGGTNNNKAANFRLSRASKSSENQRKISSNSYTEGSDLEIYGASGNLLGKAPNRSFTSAGYINVDLMGIVMAGMLP